MLLKSLSKLAKLLKLTSVLMKSEQSVKGKKYILLGHKYILLKISEIKNVRLAKLRHES